MNVKILMVLAAFVLMISGAYAYQGFNQYYYTDNYHPTVYYPSPVPTYTTSYSYYGSAAAYPSYYGYNSYSTYPAYYGGYNSYNTYYYPSYSTYGYGAYAAPAVNNYRSFGAYRDSDGWGFYYGTGSVCGNYGYC